MRGQRKPTRAVEFRPGGSTKGLERADARLLDGIDARFRAVARRAGDRLACRPGCDECCHGPFPITALDAWRLDRGVESIDPELATTLRARARAAVERLTSGFPGDPASGRLDQDQATLDRFFERHADLACPALDPRTGRCDLYEWRPVACRTYGPPLRFDTERAEPCRLCFREADRETIEACRLEHDLDEEEAVRARLPGGRGEDWAALIAFVLAEGADRGER